MPGLINAHQHTPMSLLRGFFDDLKLMNWLNKKMLPAESRMTPEDIYWGTKLAMAEMKFKALRGCPFVMESMDEHFPRSFYEFRVLFCCICQISICSLRYAVHNEGRKKSAVAFRQRSFD